MSIRLNCPSCRAAFVTSDDRLGRTVSCPKCGAKQDVPTAVLAAPARDAPRNPPSSRRRRAVAAVAVARSAWPCWGCWRSGPSPSWSPGRRSRATLHPVPPDPIEVVATDYLRAIAEGKAEDVRRLGVVDEPPAIRSYRKVHHDPARDRHLKGSFAPIAALHARINAQYAYDPAIGRFTPLNPLGPAAETLDALHDAKAKAEVEELSKKIASGTADEQLDAAVALGESLGKPMALLSETILSPRKLLPSYKQLVEDAKPPLPPDERALALDFAADRTAWDALLKRPFPTLKADGPYVLDRAEVTATAIDRLASAGDPPTPLYLTLTRFRLEGIDTGWKVTSARRQPAPPPPAETEPRPRP